MDGQQQSREQSLLAILQDPSGASGSAGSSTMPSLGKGGRFSLSSAAAASATASATASSAAAQMMMPPAVTPSVTTTGGLILGPGTQSLSLNVAALPPTIAAGKPLSAQAITLVPSKLEYRLGRSIGTTRDFIAYAVRGGKVRVIEQRTGAMTLLRDHTASLLDLEILSIFKTAHQQSAARLVTVSLDDSVRLWDLQGPSAQADMDEILVDPLLNILGHKSSSDEPMTFTRATFSPRDSNLLAIAGYAQTLFLVNVPLATSASASIQMEPNKAGGATIDLKDRTLLGGVDVLQIPATILDLRFSPDGTVLAATTDSGSVLLIDPSVKQIIRQWTPFGTGSLALDSLRFLNPFMTIVSSEGNLRTALLNLATGVVCQDISFVAESMFNVLDVHPASQTLFLGNSARASLLTLHYTFSPKTQLLASSLSIDCISGKIPAAVSLREEDAFFDFIVEFPLGDEITSLVCDPDASLSTDQGERTVHLYCVQTKTVQRFSVPLELTNPPSKEGCAPLLRSQQAAPVETVAESPQAGMDLLNLLMKKVDFDTSDGAVEKPEKTIQKRPQEAVTLSKKKQTGKTPSAAKDQRPSKSEAPPQIQAAPLQQKLFPDAPPTDNISQKLDVLMEKLHSVESRMQETNPSQMAESLASILSQTWEKTFRESIRSTLLPKLELAVGSIMTQIHETLDQGIQEILRSQASSCEHAQIPALTKIEKTLASISTQLQSNISPAALDTYFGTSDVFAPALGTILEREIKKALTSIPILEPVPMTRRWSQQSFSSPTIEAPKDEIDRDLEAGQYEKAFTSALGSSDLSVVLHICQKLDPKTVFKSDKTLISQPIVLSLVHQISLDLNKATGMKLAWLQECAINLNKADPVISSHVPRILSIVNKRLEDWIKKASMSDDSSQGHVRTAKMLLMMTASLV